MAKAKKVVNDHDGDEAVANGKKPKKGTPMPAMQDQFRAGGRVAGTGGRKTGFKSGGKVKGGC